MIIISLLFSYFLDPLDEPCNPNDNPQCADENAACASSGPLGDKCLCNEGYTANENNICQNDLSECVKEIII